MKDHLKVLGYVLFAEVLTLFINLTLSVFPHTLFRILCSICTVGILLVVMIHAGMRIAAADKHHHAAAGTVPAPHRPLLLGLTAVLPFQVCWVLLLLAKLGVIAGSFYKFYKLLAAPFLQICNLFSADITAASLPMAGLVLLELCSLLPLPAFWIAYRMQLDGKTPEDWTFMKG